MADQRSRLTMDILARVQGVQDVDRLARSVDDVGDEMQGAAGDAALLDRAVDQLEGEIAELNRELLRTGDIDVFERLGRDRSALRMLQRMRRELGEVAEVGQDAGRGFVRSFGDSLAAIPPQLRGALIAGGVTAAAAAAPLIAGAISAAVLGGVGAGGIVGGVAAAAQDSRVQAAAQSLVGGIQREFEELGPAFVGPAVDALGMLGDAGREVISGLAPDIRALAPDVRLLASGIADMARELGPGLSDALQAARPVLRLVAEELPEVGEAFSDMLTSISEDPDGAVLALRLLFDTTELLVKSFGNVVEGGSRVFEFMSKFQAVLGVTGQLLPDTTKAAQKFRDDGLDEVAGGFQRVTSSVEDANSVLQQNADLVRSQTDPMFALISAQQRLRDAQIAYTEAVDEHGRQSRQAEDAQVALAEAAVRMQGAAADAAGTFEGRLTPQMRATLEAAGSTERQILGVRDAFRRADEAGDDFARTYTARVIVQRSVRGDISFGGSAFGGGDFQHGGLVSGPPGIDRVPGMLTAGEFVVRREQAQRHLDLLRAINSGGGGGGVQPVVTVPNAGRPATVRVGVQRGDGGTNVEQAVADLMLHLVRTGALALHVREGQVVV